MHINCHKRIIHCGAFVVLFLWFLFEKLMYKIILKCNYYNKRITIYWRNSPESLQKSKHLTSDATMQNLKRPKTFYIWIATTIWCRCIFSKINLTETQLFVTIRNWCMKFSNAWEISFCNNILFISYVKLSIAIRFPIYLNMCNDVKQITLTY